MRVHRLGDEEGADRGGDGAGTCSGADLLDPGELQIRRDQRNQRAVPTSVVQARMKREIDRKKDKEELTQNATTADENIRATGQGGHREEWRCVRF